MFRSRLLFTTLTTFAIAATLGASTEALAQPTPRRDDSPAKAADPPLMPPPPPGSGAPLSTSGTDVAPVDRQDAPAPVVVGDGTQVTEQDAKIRALEARIAGDERRMQKLDERFAHFKNLRFEGFIQPQLLIQSYNSAASPNVQANGQLPEGIGANDIIAKPDGSTTNGTFFRLRRTRLRTFYETEVMRFFLQLDVLPAGGIGSGIGTIVRNAEATGIARWTRDVRTEFTAGLFFTPFRAELLEASLFRPFIERTWFILNAFPVERDLGAHARTLALDDKLIVDVGILNGQRLGERYFVQTPDLNRQKDFVASATYRLGPVTAGANAYVGRGQVVDGQQLRFKQFSKWAVNFQATVKHRLFPRLGETRILSELAFGQNMDSGVNYAFAVPQIPTDITADVENVSMRALYARAEQDIGRMITVGYRYDFYSPNTAIKNNARDTHAFLAVLKISPNLRWMHELDWAIDNVHPLGAAAPSKHIVSYSSVLQAMF